jgi:hypothetical protein
VDVPTFFSTVQDYGFTDSSNATMLRALQGSVDSIERLRPWPFLEARATLAYTGGLPTPTVAPPRIRAVLSVRHLGTGKMLEPIRLDDFEGRIGTDDNDAGDPRVYYMEAGVFKVWPLPVNGTQLTIRYIQFSTPLTVTGVETDFLIPARHHEVILFGMLRRMYDQQDDPELAATMAQQYDRLSQEMVEDLTKQQYDQPEFIHFTNPDDWYV